LPGVTWGPPQNWLVSLGLGWWGLGHDLVMPAPAPVASTAGRKETIMVSHPTYSVLIACREQADGSYTPAVTLMGLSANEALMVEQDSHREVVAAWPEQALAR